MKIKWICLFGVLAAACFSAYAESVVVAKPGKSGASVIQQAIDVLPAGRTFIGTVKPVGEFKLEQGLVLPDYTRLDLSEARLVLADGVKAPMIANSDFENGNRHLEIIGGVIDGNKKGQGAGDFHGILLIRTEQVRITDLDVVNCSGDGIRLNGKGRHTRDLQLRNLRLVGNNRCGLNVMWAERNIFVSDVYAAGNKELGIRSDHSEGLYQNICANSNKGHGIFIRNIFGGTYNNLTASRNGGMGIHVQGVVCSRGSNWGAHNNSTETPGKYADIFFDGNDTLSYGITKMTVLNNITAGPYREYGPASEKTAVEFGKGVREGLQINNLLELKSTAGKQKERAGKHD
jgi:hypothetical protein